MIAIQINHNNVDQYELLPVFTSMVKQEINQVCKILKDNDIMCSTTVDFETVQVQMPNSGRIENLPGRSTMSVQVTRNEYKQALKHVPPSPATN